jgi:hypothetical protein
LTSTTINDRVIGARTMTDDFAGRLTALMAERGLGVLALARRVPCDKALISRAASGRDRPSLRVAQRVDEVLGAGGELISLHASGRPASAGGHSEPDDDDMNRRELLRIFSMAGVLMAGTAGTQIDWERLGSLTGGQHPVSPADVDELAALNDHLWQVFMLSRSKRLVFPIVRDQLGVMTGSLQRAQGSAEFGRLCALASDLFQLAGEILFDGSRYTDAAHCYTLAATAAREARSPDLWACALTRHAFIGVYEGSPQPAAGLLELASALAWQGDSTLSTRHWVAAVQAEAFAGLGRFRECEHALDQAEQVIALGGQVHNGGWLRFDGSRLAEGRGTCYAALGRPDLAEAALLTALAGNLTARRRGVVHADLAMTGVQQRDMDQITEHASAALDIARDTGSGVVASKLAALQDALGSFLADSRARQLDEQITAVAGIH